MGVHPAASNAKLKPKPLPQELEYTERNWVDMERQQAHTAVDEIVPLDKEVVADSAWGFHSDFVESRKDRQRIVEGRLVEIVLLSCDVDRSLGL